MLSKLKNSKITGTHEFYMVIALAALAIFFGIGTKGLFLSGSNLLNMVISYSYLGIMAMGMLVVIISGGIDMTIMLSATISQYVMALFMLNSGMANWATAILLSLAVGIVLGLLNAVLVHYLKAPTLIITIATMSAYFGLLMYFTKGVRLFSFPAWFSGKTDGKTFAVAIGLLAAAVVVTFVIMKFTKMGRKVYAIGGNLEGAKRVGINILLVHLFVYGFVGAMGALGGVVHLYLVQQAAPNALYGGEMDVIAMAVLGGVNLAGGKGTVGGTIIGMLLVATLSNGLLLLGVSSYWQDFFIGAVILVSFCFSGWRAIKNKEKESKGGKLDD